MMTPPAHGGPPRDEQERKPGGGPAAPSGRWPGILARRLCLAMIRFYQLVVSPLLPPSCRFTPTCSQYAQEAITRYGVRRGGYLALKRILRCHPFSSGGFDPVK